MKKLNWYFLIPLVFILGCGANGPAGTGLLTTQKGGHLKISLKFKNQGNPEKIKGAVDEKISPEQLGVKSIWIGITPAEGEIIENTFDFKPGSRATITEIPIGPVLLEIKAMDENGIELFFGSTTVEVHENDITVVESFALLSPAKEAEYRLPPLISEIRVDSVDDSSARVRFLSNIPSQSRVKLLQKMTGIVLSTYTPLLPEAYTNNHEITLHTLLPGTEYLFIIETISERKLVSKSEEILFNTGNRDGIKLDGSVHLPDFFYLTKDLVLRGSDATNISPDQSFSQDSSSLTGIYPLRVFINGEFAALVADDGSYTASGIKQAEDYHLEVRTDRGFKLLYGYYSNTQAGTTDIDSVSTARCIIFNEMRNLLPDSTYLDIPASLDEIKTIQNAVDTYYQNNTGIENFLKEGDIVQVGPVAEVIKQVVPGFLEEYPARADLDKIIAWSNKFAQLLSTTNPDFSSTEFLSLFATEEFLMGGQNLTEFIADIQEDDDVLGIKFSEFELLSINRESSPQKAIVRMKIKVGLESFYESFHFLKLDGKWLFAGDGRIVETSVRSFARISWDNTISTGLQLDVYAKSENKVDYAVVNGRGLPANGILLVKRPRQDNDNEYSFELAKFPYQGQDTKALYENGGNHDYILTEEQVAAISDGSSYDFKLFSNNATPTDPSDDIHLETYSNILQHKPLNSTALSIQSFPSLNSPDIEELLRLIAEGGEATLNFSVPENLLCERIHIYRHGPEAGDDYEFDFSEGESSLIVTIPVSDYPVFGSGINLTAVDQSGREFYVEMSGQNGQDFFNARIRPYVMVDNLRGMQTGLSFNFHELPMQNVDYIIVLGNGLPQSGYGRDGNSPGLLLASNFDRTYYFLAQPPYQGSMTMGIEQDPNRYPMPDATIQGIADTEEYQIQYWNDAGTPLDFSDDQPVASESLSLKKRPRMQSELLTTPLQLHASTIEQLPLISLSGGILEIKWDFPGEVHYGGGVHLWRTDYQNTDGSDSGIQPYQTSVLLDVPTPVFDIMGFGLHLSLIDNFNHEYSINWTVNPEQQY
ncbi:hypothetical protein ACFL35_00820 [Candidatus Riflebacteria bacterium]